MTTDIQGSSIQRLESLHEPEHRQNNEIDLPTYFSILEPAKSAWNICKLRQGLMYLSFRNFHLYDAA